MSSGNRFMVVHRTTTSLFLVVWIFFFCFVLFCFFVPGKQTTVILHAVYCMYWVCTPDLVLCVYCLSLWRVLLNESKDILYLISLPLGVLSKVQHKYSNTTFLFNTYWRQSSETLNFNKKWNNNIKKNQKSLNPNWVSSVLKAVSHLK